MQTSRWPFVLCLVLSLAVRKVELKPGISASHGKILASSAVGRQSQPNTSATPGPGAYPSSGGGLGTNLNSNGGGRTFVHDKGVFTPPRTEPPVQPKLLCPKNFDLVGDSCVFLQTIPANVECPQGYDVSRRDFNLECTRVSLVNAQFECPNGKPPKFVENSAFCPSEHFENPTIRCPTGTVQKENECITVDTKPPALKCSEGYSLDNNSNCKQVIEHKPMLTCPPETTLDKTTMACVAKVVVEPLEVCPPGAIPVKSRDLSDMKGLLNRIAIVKEETQYRHLQEIPTLGSINQKKGLESQGSPLSSSSASLSNANGGYKGGTRSDSNSSTNGNANDNANHRTGNRIPALSSAEQYSGNQSSSKASEDLQGSYSGIGKNAQEERVDTFYQALYDSSRDLKNSGGIINESLLGDEVVCLILKYTTPHVECPQGLELSKDGICTHYDSFTPKKTCEGGIEPDSDNMCVIEKLLPAEVECPKGHTLDIISGMCVRKETEEIACPEGTTLNKATIKCEAEPKCPESFTMNNSTMICEREKSVPPHPKCPEGTEYNEESDSCKTKDAQLPLIMCPEGYEQRGDDCVLEKSIPASFYCPPDYYQTNKNACVKWYQDYMLQCPQFLELKEESFAYRTDLIPPPGAGRGPVVPSAGAGRRLQEYDGTVHGRFYDVPDSHGKRYTNTDREGQVYDVHKRERLQREQFESLSSQIPIVIRSYKTRGMVCFGWGRRYKMIVSCPEGTVLLNEKCVETRIMEPDNMCAKGYTYNEVEMVCEYQHKAMPNVECPPFMNLTVSANGSPVCLGDKREPAEVTCPTGFEWIANSLNCQSREFAQPNIGCVKGYSIVKEKTGTFCQRRDTIKPTPSCPPEYRYDEVNKICIYEVKLHDVRERNEYMQNVRTNFYFPS
ncbi:oocyst wall protein 4 [Cryptosporidium ryanae]|uniref:oocyst wall protein 4 n=1 Tax=Cryptosporidium ryanae TaxID=515981 RepID=UPI00351A0AA4|nr:oocyst wall protein 4 [Cryptosporidium ryanae]